MSEFRMTKNKFGNIHIMVCQGSMDEGCLEYCRNNIVDMVKNGLDKIIFDMKQVEYVTSAGWAIFVSSLKKVRKSGGDIKLASLNLRPKHIFELLELENIIDAFSTVEDAIMAFNKDNKADVQDY